MNKMLINNNDHFCRLFNRQLTSKLIKLHSAGYEFDFYLLKNGALSCVQSGQFFDDEDASVILIDQVYDFITNSYKYLHKVETACGKKGILLIEGIYRFQLNVPLIHFTLASKSYLTA